MAVPIQQRSAWQRAARRWFDPRGRNMSYPAFILFRLAGIGLTLYLAAHFVALYNLVRGPQAWASFIQLAHSPVFLVFDVVVFAGVLVHGLNGLRVAFLGLGFGLKRQRLWLAITALAVVVLLVYGSWLFISKA